MKIAAFMGLTLLTIVTVVLIGIVGLLKDSRSFYIDERIAFCERLQAYWKTQDHIDFIEGEMERCHNDMEEIAKGRQFPTVDP